MAKSLSFFASFFVKLLTEFLSFRREIRTISRLTAPPAASSEGVTRGRGGARSPPGAESGAELSGSGGSGDEDYSPGDTWHTHQYRYTTISQSRLRTFSCLSSFLVCSTERILSYP